MAYQFKIKPDSGSTDEGLDSHQSSPHWVLTFVRWEQRDTLRTDPRAGVDEDGNVDANKHDYRSTRGPRPLVVENDCIACGVTVNKGNLTHTMSATLVHTDVNYMTQVAPGDFVIVNMLNWSRDARRVANKARFVPDPDPKKKQHFQAINAYEDGFKGVFKVQSVRKVLRTDPSTGERTYLFQITGHAFTEFNNTIYFNPEMLTEEDQNVTLYMGNIGANWANITTEKTNVGAQSVVSELIRSFVGAGIGPTGQTDKNGTLRSPNTQMFIPQALGRLLGHPTAKAAKDIYNYIFGIQQYRNEQNIGATKGFNPKNLEEPIGRFYNTNKTIRGQALVKPEYWNQIKVWSILNQFINSPLNEMFSCFRISPNGDIMPTIVLRQTPFTSPGFKSVDPDGGDVTKFLDLPRWTLDPRMVISFDIGRDEAMRINFVQYFGRSTLDEGGYGSSEEIAMRNYLLDIDDVSRSGLRPYVASSTFDLVEAGQTYESPKWARIVGDALIGGHLKLSGTIECVGILEPIAVGDNLQFDGTVYHIEEVAHSCSYDRNGNRQFRTRLSVSSGVAINSGANTLYSEMAFASATSKLNADWAAGGSKILPGISESQSTVYRPDDVDNPTAKGGGFEQPNHPVSIGQSTRKDTSGGKPGEGE